MFLSEEDGFPEDEHARAVMPRRGPRRDAQTLELVTGGLGLSKRFAYFMGQQRSGTATKPIVPGATQQTLPRSDTDQRTGFDQITTGQ